MVVLPCSSRQDVRGEHHHVEAPTHTAAHQDSKWEWLLRAAPPLEAAVLGLPGVLLEVEKCTVALAEVSDRSVQSLSCLTETHRHRQVRSN